MSGSESSASKMFTFTFPGLFGHETMEGLSSALKINRSPSFVHAMLQSRRGCTATQQRWGSPNQTAYEWSFADEGSSLDANAVCVAREEVDPVTYHPSAGSGRHAHRTANATATSSNQLSRLHQISCYREKPYRSIQPPIATSNGKRDRVEAKERLEDMVRPKKVGLERMMGNEHPRRKIDRACRGKGNNRYETDG